MVTSFDQIDEKNIFNTLCTFIPDLLAGKNGFFFLTGTKSSQSFNKLFGYFEGETFRPTFIYDYIQKICSSPRFKSAGYQVHAMLYDVFAGKTRDLTIAYDNQFSLMSAIDEISEQKKQKQKNQRLQNKIARIFQSSYIDVLKPQQIPSVQLEDPTQISCLFQKAIKVLAKTKAGFQYFATNSNLVFSIQFKRKGKIQSQAVFFKIGVPLNMSDHAQKQNSEQVALLGRFIRELRGGYINRAKMISKKSFLLTPFIDSLLQSGAHLTFISSLLYTDSSREMELELLEKVAYWNTPSDMHDPLLDFQSKQLKKYQIVALEKQREHLSQKEKRLQDRLKKIEDYLSHDIFKNNLLNIPINKLQAKEKQLRVSNQQLNKNICTKQTELQQLVSRLQADEEAKKLQLARLKSQLQTIQTQTSKKSKELNAMLDYFKQEQNQLFERQVESQIKQLPMKKQTPSQLKQVLSNTDYKLVMKAQQLDRRVKVERHRQEETLISQRKQLMQTIKKHKQGREQLLNRLHRQEKEIQRLQKII